MSHTSLPRLGFALVVTFASAALAAAQSLGDGWYRLLDQSSYTRGCFPPCMCPIMQEVPAHGVFNLRFAGVDPLFEHYAVSDVLLTFDTGGGKEFFTGAGSYQLGGEVALLQRLQLQLRSSLDPETTIDFDSGYVPVGGDPAVPIDVTISIHGMFCYDQVFRLAVAQPDPRDVAAYRLDRASQYQEGCFLLCDCVLRLPQPLRGSFTVIEIANEFPLTAYAVVGVNWSIMGTSAGERSRRVTGGGVYSVIGDFTLTDDLLLTLAVAGAPPQTWHSTSDGSPFDFPLIDKTLTLHDYLCYDQVFTLVGRPVSDAPRPQAEQSPLQAPHAARP